MNIAVRSHVLHRRLERKFKNKLKHYYEDDMDLDYKKRHPEYKRRPYRLLSDNDTFDEYLNRYF